VVDKNPPDAVARLRGDSLGNGLAAARGRYSESFLRAIEWAMALEEKKRPQSVEEWKEALLREKTVAVPAPISSPAIVPKPVPPSAAAHKKKGTTKNKRWPYVVGIVVLGVALLGFWLKNRAMNQELKKDQTQLQRESPAITETREQRLERETKVEFEAADKNGDGYLSPEEVRGRFPVIAREFQRIDTNGDGKISLEEFQNLRRRQLEKRLEKKE